MNKSTATTAQLNRLIQALRQRPHNSYELRRLGLYQAPARVKQLRDAGYEIVTHRITLTDRDGFSHRGCALYELITEPGTGAIYE